MTSESYKRYIEPLQKCIDRLWYLPVIAILAALDNFVILIPSDGIAISSAAILPKRWISFAVFTTIGSAAGALVLAHLVQAHGLPQILEYFPKIQESTTWVWTDKFFSSYGLLLVFALAMTPLLQQPAVILAALAGTSLLQLTAVIFFGRLVKYLGLCYLGRRAPELVEKLWESK